MAATAAADVDPSVAPPNMVATVSCQAKQKAAAHRRRTNLDRAGRVFA
jgi:hypothetical protein